MKKIRLISVLVLIILLVTAGSAYADANRNFVAHLTGDDTNSTGQTVFQFSKDGQSLSYQLNVAHIQNVIMAHIHVAETAGGSGPPVLWLYPSSQSPQEIPGYFSGVLGFGTASADDLVGPLAGMTLDDLRAAIDEGRAYVNIHTTEFPGGLIRGPIK